jgi:putative transposase
VGDFAGLLRAGEDDALSMAIRRGENVGRPLGDDAFLKHIEALVGRIAAPQKESENRAW